ncbi:ABC-three component system middle component 6 [Salipiger sp.]|uniref:ABC-three component system middle component 6 n=1 Tax=Salipiger sp. TaxID=2078585 RepID=UPI003A96DD0F
MPTKHIKTENALIGVGAEILALLDRDKTVSRLFSDIQEDRRANELSTIHFDWFLLAMDFLFSIGAIRFESGLIKKMNQ